jgi:hypothetical protein
VRYSDECKIPACSLTDETVTDCISGKETRGLTPCADLNFDGKCKNFEEDEITALRFEIIEKLSSLLNTYDSHHAYYRMTEGEVFNDIHYLINILERDDWDYYKTPVVEIKPKKKVWWIPAAWQGYEE